MEFKKGYIPTQEQINNRFKKGQLKSKNAHRFLKGHKINKGKHHITSEETKRKISENKKGKPYKLKESIILKNKCIFCGKEVTKLARNYTNRYPNYWYERKFCSLNCYRKSLIGKKISEEIRKKMSKSHKGKKSHFWKGGITSKNIVIRSGLEYRLWRESVFKRDDYTCIWCGQRGGELNADHIKPFSLFPELRFAIDNGRTLCIDCHKKTDTYLYKFKKINK